jgi:hypothetical protein
MDFKKIEKGFSWKPIVCCVGLNLTAAGAVFVASFLIMGFGLLTVFYTLAAWTAAVTASFVFWICWFLKKIRHVSAKIRVGFVALMLILLAADWAVMLSVLKAFGGF